MNWLRAKIAWLKAWYQLITDPFDIDDRDQVDSWHEQYLSNKDDK